MQFSSNYEELCRVQVQQYLFKILNDTFPNLILFCCVVCTCVFLENLLLLHSFVEVAWINVVSEIKLN